MKTWWCFACVFLKIYQSLPPELYIEFCSKIPGRLHSLPTDVDILKVRKICHWGGQRSPGPSSKSRGSVGWLFGNGSLLPPEKEEMETFFFLFFLWLHPQHMEVPRLGVESELLLPVYNTATAILDPSWVFNLHHSSQQRQILNPLSEARD